MAKPTSIDLKSMPGRSSTSTNALVKELTQENPALLSKASPTRNGLLPSPTEPSTATEMSPADGRSGMAGTDVQE